MAQTKMTFFSYLMKITIDKVFENYLKMFNLRKHHLKTDVLVMET